MIYINSTNPVPDYYCFHCIPKSLKRIRLINDDEDKLTYLLFLATACLDSDLGLLAFNILNTHLHFLVGIKWASDSKADPAWLEHTIKYFIWEINRQYGVYFREKYNYKGNIFSKNKDKFKYVPYSDGIRNAIAYIHNNATAINKFAVYEDDPFNSYNYYLASFLQNNEFQNLPLIQEITTSLDSLKIFNALDLNFGLKQFSKSKSMHVNMNEFLNVHSNALIQRDKKNQNFSATNRYRDLGILPLLNDRSQLQIQETQGHTVKIYTDSLGNYKEIIKENVEFPFQNFAKHFPYCNESSELKLAFSKIRKENELEFKSFIKSVSSEVSERKISEIVGVSRNYIRKIRYN